LILLSLVLIAVLAQDGAAVDEFQTFASTKRACGVHKCKRGQYCYFSKKTHQHVCKNKFLGFCKTNKYCRKHNGKKSKCITKKGRTFGTCSHVFKHKHGKKHHKRHGRKHHRKHGRRHHKKHGRKHHKRRHGRKKPT